jgi:hypothetical protein
LSRPRAAAIFYSIDPFPLAGDPRLRLPLLVDAFLDSEENAPATTNARRLAMRRNAKLFVPILLVSLLVSSAAVAKEPAPEGRTYFILVIGLADDPYQAEPDCLTFDALQACTLDGDTCLDWEPLASSPDNRQTDFSMTTELEDDGLIILLEGRGTVESRGAKSSISYAAHASVLDQQANFAFAGRQTSAARCRRAVDDFRALMDGQ